MGLIFRKSKSFLKGLVKVNASKSGVGFSIGKGIRYTKRSDGGKEITINTPIKGLYWKKRLK